jgi:hypothetical protein
VESWRGISMAIASGRRPNRNVLRGVMSLGREPTNFGRGAEVVPRFGGAASGSFVHHAAVAYGKAVARYLASGNPDIVIFGNTLRYVALGTREDICMH